MKAFYPWLFFLTVALVVLLAQGAHSLAAGYSVLNSGIAFSINLPPTFIYFFSAFFILAIAGFYFLARQRDGVWGLAFGVIVGGGLSNFLERFYQSGQVADYIPFFGSTINLADVFIVGGIIWAFFLLYTNDQA